MADNILKKVEAWADVILQQLPKLSVKGTDKKALDIVKKNAQAIRSDCKNSFTECEELKALEKISPKELADAFKAQDAKQFFYHLAWRWHNVRHDHRIDFKTCTYPGCIEAHKHLREIDAFE